MRKKRDGRETKQIRKISPITNHLTKKISQLKKLAQMQKLNMILKDNVHENKVSSLGVNH
jgi:hypothetical protein